MNYALRLLTTFSCLCISLCAELRSEVVNLDLTHDGESRSAIIYVPTAVTDNPHTVHPILFVLNGGGGTAAGIRSMTQQGFEPLADTDGWIVIYPDGIDNNWNDDSTGKPEQGNIDDIDDVDFLLTLADTCAERWNGDADGLYFSGLSNGAMMTFRMAREASDRINGIACVVGLLPSETPDSAWSRSVPCIIIAGTEDPLMPYDGGDITLPPILGGGTRGPVFSAAASADWVAQKNGLAGTTVAVWMENPVVDNTITQRFTYDNGDIGTAVELLRVVGGGHTWPQGTQYLAESVIGRVTQDFNGCQVIWDFFQANGHPQRNHRQIQINSSTGEAWDCNPSTAASDQDAGLFQQLNPVGSHVLTTTVSGSS